MYLVNAIQAGILTQSTKERLEQLEEDREKLKTSILQAQLKRPQFSKEEIVSWIERFKYGNIDDPDYRSEVIDTFVNSVYVYDDKVILTYNYKDGSDTISKEAVDRAFGSDMEKLAPPRKSVTPSGVADFLIWIGGFVRRKVANPPGALWPKANMPGTVVLQSKMTFPISSSFAIFP